MSIAIVSSVYGGYDPIWEPAFQVQDCEYIMVTDREDIKDSLWQPVVERRPNVPPRLASRIAKCNPWNYTDADTVIWVDGNIEITSNQFTDWCTETAGDSLVCQRRLSRLDIYDEVAASFKLPKWEGEPLNEMAEHYLSHGFPANYGIWWCGLFVWSKEFYRKHPGFGNSWLAEMVRWTCQDQMPYSFLMHDIGIRPAHMLIRYANIAEDEKVDPTGMLPVVACSAEHFTLHNHPDASK